MIFSLPILRAVIISSNALVYVQTEVRFLEKFITFSSGALARNIPTSL
jgi:hypothetical protein